MPFTCVTNSPLQRRAALVVLLLLALSLAGCPRPEQEMQNSSTSSASGQAGRTYYSLLSGFGSVLVMSTDRSGNGRKMELVRGTKSREVAQKHFSEFLGNLRCLAYPAEESYLLQTLSPSGEKVDNHLVRNGEILASFPNHRVTGSYRIPVRINGEIGLYNAEPDGSKAWLILPDELRELDKDQFLRVREGKYSIERADESGLVIRVVSPDGEQTAEIDADGLRIRENGEDQSADVSSSTFGSFATDGRDLYYLTGSDRLKRAFGLPAEGEPPELDDPVEACREMRERMGDEISPDS